MIPLILSIGSSSLIFVIFKLFAKYRIDTLQAIIVNYLTAACIGLLLFSNEWEPEAADSINWFVAACLISGLLISLFFLMAKSSQDNGVASTSISVKMSMAISLVLMMVMYHETPTPLKITGIVLAIIGVFLVSSGREKTNVSGNGIWMLLVLFIGNGLLDFSLNYIQKNVLTILTPSLFTAFALGMAGILGLLFLSVSLFFRPVKIAGRNVIAGIALGIPNFFSIYFLLLSYRTTGWTDTTVLSITNVSVVLISALLGYVLFREEKSGKKILGLIAAVLAIIVLYYAN